MAKYEATAEELKAQAREAADEVGKHARRAADEVQGAAESLRDKGAEFAESARKHGHEYAERARDEARRIYREGERYAADLADHADDYYVEVARAVRRHPARALGIAAGVGFLLGLIISRR